MGDIFLSYKSEDRAKAQIIAEAMERNGYSVWWDRIIPPGRTWDEVIEEELAAANCMVILWSKESVKSEWVRTEASEGKRRKILIPVLIEDVTPPFAFRLIEAAKLIDWDGTVPNPEFDLLLGSVSRMLGKEPAPEMEIQKMGDQEEDERKKAEVIKAEEARAEEEKQKRLQKEEKDKLKKEKERQKELRRVAIKDAIQENIHAVKRKVSKEKIIALLLIFCILLVGYWVFPSIDVPNRTNGHRETPTPILETSTPTPSTPSPTPIPKYSTNSIDMEFVLIPAGEFDMGSQSSEVGRYDDEGPVHHVTISEDFYMSKYEVTQKQWREVMGSAPSYFKGDDLPVEQISWDDVQDFIRELNKKENTDIYRLPTEAEWEYAARAGTITRYSFGDDGSDLGDYAWYIGNSAEKTHPVGQRKPNSWGLYDMHGNVYEWVQDKWHSSYEGAPADGSAWEDGSGAFRVFRGGSWGRNAEFCRSAVRDGSVPGFRADILGFRLLKEL
jgi:formylglycine-generating enzyme required for sulfatase activity